MNILGLVFMYIGALMIFYHYDTELNKKMENIPGYIYEAGKLINFKYDNGKQAYTIVLHPINERD